MPHLMGGAGSGNSGSMDSSSSEATMTPQGEYDNAVKTEREMANEVHQKENELKQLENDYKKAADRAYEACKQDKNSEDCKLASDYARSLQDQVKDAKKDLEESEEAYYNAQEESWKKEGALLDGKQQEAEKALEDAKKVKEEACKLPDSDECKAAKKAENDARGALIEINDKVKEHDANKPSKPEPVDPFAPIPADTIQVEMAEQNQQSEGIDSKPTAQEEYQHAADDEREKANEVRQKENELKQLEREMEQAQKDKDKACADDPNSEACSLAKITLGTYENQVKAKEDDLNKAKSEYDSATAKSKKSKINMLEKQKEETNQRMNDLIEQAQITCAGNSSSQSCIELTKQINELSQKLSGIIDELDKLKQ